MYARVQNAKRLLLENLNVKRAFYTYDLSIIIRFMKTFKEKDAKKVYCFYVLEFDVSLRINIKILMKYD